MLFFRLSRVSSVAMIFISQLALAEEAVTPVVKPSENIVQMILGLILVLGAILILVWLMKQINHSNHGASSVMKIKGYLPLSPKEKLVLVDIAGEQLLIGVAPGFVGHIKSLSQPIDEGQSPKNISSAFSDTISALLKKNNQHAKIVE